MKKGTSSLTSVALGIGCATLVLVLQIQIASTAGGNATDPGVRRGAAGAGDPLADLTSSELRLFNVGLGITFISFAYAAYLVLRKVFFDDTLLGFTAIMAMLAMSLGVTTTALGLVGIYLGKVFNQVQSRPTYIVKDVYRQAAIEMNTPAYRNGETS